jgi:hypothetical protein
MTQGVQEDGRRLPAIKSESHFVQVGSEMLRADTMPRSHDAALQETESGFDRIGMNVAVNVDAILVADSFVLRGRNSSSGHCVWVSSELIRHDDINILAHVFADILRHGASLRIFGVKESQIAIALTDANNYFFGFLASVDAQPDFLSADVGFVHLDSTAQHWLVYFPHRRTNAMAEIPSSFVADSKGTLHLISGESLACFHKQNNSGEPSGQRKVRIVEHGSGSHGEVILTLGTIELFIGLDPRDMRAVAPWAVNTIWPTQSNQNLSALVVCVEQPLYV